MANGFHAVVKGGTIHPSEPVDLEDGQTLECKFALPPAGIEPSKLASRTMGVARKIADGYLHAILHDLSNCLQIANTWLSAAQHQTRAFDEELRNCIAEAGEKIDEAWALVETARPRSARTVRKIISILHDVIGPALSELRAAGRAPRCDTDFPSFMSLPPIYADRTALTRLVLLLVHRAVGSAREGDEHPRIQIAAEKRGPEIHISFRDWGTGVSDVFDSLLAGKSDAIGRRDFEFAIDLFVAEEIARAHGGTLTLRNRENPTEFMLVLPEINTTPPEH